MKRREKRRVAGASPDDAAQGRDVVNGREEALDAEDGGTSQSRGAGDSRLDRVERDEEHARHEQQQHAAAMVLGKGGRGEGHLRS